MVKFHRSILGITNSEITFLFVFYFILLIAGTGNKPGNATGFTRNEPTRLFTPLLSITVSLITT